GSGSAAASWPYSQADSFSWYQLSTPAVMACAAGGTQRESIQIPLFVDIVLVVVPLVVVFLVFVLVPVLVLFLGFVLVGLGPTLGLLGHLQVHLVPCLQVDLLDVPIEILDLDELRVLIDRQHAERFFFFQILVPPAGNWLVISAHAYLPSSGRDRLRR